ncbi:MAG TPA: DMT family transporter [Noviherbaspirillum sp.]|nr:DMT family transporter [Noviherbaspirillum sp.]
MPASTTFLLTALAMIAFAGNSLLCRLALKDTGIDAAGFTAIRLLSGALTLWMLVRLRGSVPAGAGTWRSALALFAYAVFFSYAYVNLSAATGALLLFGAVQATMIGYGLWTGERFGLWRSLGLACALAGLVGLLMPGLSAPPLSGSVLMLLAGVAWGVYSLFGRGVVDPLAVTAGNFNRAALLGIALAIVALPWLAPDWRGAWYAILSGALASGVGYAIWYKALPALRATSAATIQLSVPVIAAAGGVVLLGEAISLRLVLASIAVLGGIALVVLVKEGLPAGDAAHPRAD